MSQRPDVKVLYIAGWGRSGSTLLTNLLGQVPGFFSGGELRYLWERNLTEGHDCGCGREFLECPVWSQIVTETNAVQAAPSMTARLAETSSDKQIPALMTSAGSEKLLGRLGEGADTLADLYRSIADVTGSHVIVDSSKVPSYAALLERVPGIDVRVLHLVRDPRAVAYSWHRRKMQHDVGREMLRRSAFESGWRWSVRNAEVRLFWRATNPRFMRMRYENVIDHPEDSLQQIFDFIEESDAPLPFIEPGVAEMDLTHSSSGNPNRFVTGRVELRRDDEWRRKMTSRDRATVTALTWPQLLLYGYGVGAK